MTIAPLKQAEYLAWLHCPRTSIRKLMAFAAYFDDGGTNRSQRIGVLAGYAAQKEEWNDFDAEWDQLVSDPKVPYFKAHDCD